MADVALYSFPGSLYSSIARLGLAEKGVAYDSRLVDIGPAMKNYEPWYMRINPRVVVPTLIHGDHVVCDATKVVAYIDEHFDGPSLTPSADADAQRMRDWIARAEAVPCRELSHGTVPAAIRPIMRHVVMPRRARLLRRHRARAPELAEHYDARLADVEAWTATIFDPEAVAALWSRAAETLDVLEAELSDGSFVGGPTYSQADVLWTPILARVRMLGLVDEGFDGRPAVSAYYQRVRARPTFDQAEVAERMQWGVVARLAGRFFLPRIAIAAVVLTAAIWLLVILLSG